MVTMRRGAAAARAAGPIRPRRAIRHPERDEQRALIARIDWVLAHWPEEYPLLAYVHSVPNGGEHQPFAWDGQRPGLEDLVCDVRRPDPAAPDGFWSGLKLEGKRPGGGQVATRPNRRLVWPWCQAWWHAAHRAQGFRVEVWRGCDQAWTLLCTYLGYDDLLIRLRAGEAVSVACATGAPESR